MPTLSRNFSHEKNKIRILTPYFLGKIIKKFRFKVEILSEKYSKNSDLKSEFSLEFCGENADLKSAFLFLKKCRSENADLKCRLENADLQNQKNKVC